MSRDSFLQTQMYNLLQPYLDGDPLHNVFSTQDQTYHTGLKRSIGNLYTMSSMANIEDNIDRSIEVFMGKLKGFTKGSSAIVNISAWLQFFAFDCIGEINFSQPMGFMDAGKDLDDICELDHEMMMYFALVGAWSFREDVQLTAPVGSTTNPREDNVQPDDMDESDEAQSIIQGECLSHIR